MARSEFAQRVMVAVIGIPVAIAVVYLGGWALAALLMIIAALAALEFYRLAEQKKVRPLRVPGAALAAGCRFGADAAAAHVSVERGAAHAERRDGLFGVEPGGLPAVHVD